MSTLSYKRRTKGTGSQMAPVVVSEEVSKYFASEHEWRLASDIYWSRFNLRRPIPVDLEKYNIPLWYFNHLMSCYKRFLLHKYTSNK